MLTGSDIYKKWRPPWASVSFQHTAKAMIWSSVQFYSKQRHTAHLLDDTEPVAAEILDVMTRRADHRKRNPTPLELPRLNYDIHNRIYVHKRQQRRDFVEILDRRTNVTKMWIVIKGIDGRAKRETENEAIAFNGSSFSSSTQLATRFIQQFKT